MVEFALIAPAFFLVLIGVIVTGIVVMNLMAFNNALRDVARAAAVCGSATATGGGGDAKLPDGTTNCSTLTLQSYLKSQIDSLHGGASWNQTETVTLINSDGTTTTASDFSPVGSCAVGSTVKVQVDITQPLYLPLVGVFLGNNGSTTTRTFSSSAEAKCER